MNKIEQDIFGLVGINHYEEDEKLKNLKAAVLEYVSDRKIVDAKDKVNMIFLLAAIMKIPEREFNEIIERLNAIIVIKDIESTIKRPKH